MKRALRTISLLALAALAGVAGSEAIYRSPALRDILARFREISPIERNLRTASEKEPVTKDEIDRELDLLRAQFGDENAFAQVLASSGLSLGALRTEVTEHLRARSWLEKQIAPQLAVPQESAEQFYETHGAQFLRPQCYRASHLFLAAPEGSAPELVAAKLSAIQGLGVRVLAGEPLTQLATEASEDEASRLRGGNLGYFAASRMPSEFFAEVEKLQAGQVSGPFRSHLGFHIVQLSDVKPSVQLSFDDARPEIVVALENEKRAAVVKLMNERLSAQ